MGYCLSKSFQLAKLWGNFAIKSHFRLAKFLTNFIDNIEFNLIQGNFNMSVIATDAFNSSLLSLATSSGGPLHVCEAMCFTNIPSPDDHTLTISGLTECSYPGYSRVPIVWESVYQNIDGSFSLQGQLIDFQPVGITPSLTGQTITGYAILGGTSYTTLCLAEVLPDAVPLDSNQSAFLLSPQYNIGASTNYNGAATVIS
jgi:hypothetical protein